MRLDVVSIFPEYLAALDVSLVGKAAKSGLLDVRVHDLREWTHDRHRTVDDTPYGGGAGMVMKPEPWGEALDDVAPADGPSQPRLIVPTPAGRPFTQALAYELAAEPWLAFACGRYEGIDARVAEHAAERMRMDEVSIGDYVLNGGEVAVLVMVEAIARLLPGVIGNPESLAEESHSGDGLLEYPVYTKPTSWRGHEVPEVLLSGNHALIAKWHHDQSVRRTAERRPDLLAAWGATVGHKADVVERKEDAALLAKVLPASEADAGEINTLQRAAYLTEGQAYADLTIPPLQEELAGTIERIAQGGVWKAMVGARVVGSVQVVVEGEVARIGRLMVAPDWQGRGIGKKLLRVAEQAAPAEVTRYELSTGAESERNLQLYRNTGYREVSREQQTAKVELVLLMKRRRRR
ncbi:tRNA (guanine37-N1)-methyltransferase [Kribbella orskensis]|uniref:tRNA (guanine-N(1)-)-methyltransferase n=1 Tax=Kribbella orskensis TaxID=2512216 RepID=A0ABY2BFM5_9ACTN|nr:MULTISPECIES: tRNA (guanosine(37)-N1)-methyltransferase TrmD [Kribbella]TCN37616.1 tRNA (guanine37-N1)-methyltransferase [Kribbella sp. VKM Ac-2500]TCO18882.1 tRNA (guanine37-N1)-methyltransferase [Kribbella orskensis]